MKTLQEYKDIYSGIASELGIRGDSVEVLVGLLANASYISEVENAVYMREASLGKATLSNSKIQKCMDQMYSVYRGACPRIILHVRFKTSTTIKRYDEIVSSNNFKVYFDLAWNGNEEPESGVPLLENFTLDMIQSSPMSDYYILGFIAPKVEEISGFTLSPTQFFVSTSVDQVNLSADMYLIDDNSKESIDVTRSFGEHVRSKGKTVFDLTTTSFGSRLYFTPGGDSKTYTARYFVYSLLSDYNPAELRKIKIKDTDSIPISDSDPWASRRGGVETENGIVFIDSTQRDSMDQIHYLASKQRYTNQVIRSNSDISTVLKNDETIGKYIKQVTYRFESSPTQSILSIYYVPSEEGEIPEEKKEEWIADDSKKAYFVTNDIRLETGDEYKAQFNINLVIYRDQSAGTIGEDVSKILRQYEDKFDIDFDILEEEIKAHISKISAVKSIKDYSVQYFHSGALSPKPNIGAIIPPYFEIELRLNMILS